MERFPLFSADPSEIDVAAEQVSEDRPAAAILHLAKFDAGTWLQQFSCDMVTLDTPGGGGYRRAEALPQAAEQVQR
jgi:hypothetical protein